MITKQKAESGRSTPFASILYAEPGALGLMCNIISASTVAIDNVIQSKEAESSKTISGIHLIVIGGLIQLTCGFLSFRRNDHLTGTAFVVFAALWSNQGIVNIISTSHKLSSFPEAVLSGLIGYMVVTIILFICSLFVNYIMPPVLLTMLLALIFESIGLFHDWAKYVAAAFELIIVFTATYAVVVMTTKGISQRYILPGFGNAPIDPLLFKTKTQSKRKNESKKNTKYAESMGMGYMGTVVPSILLGFYYLGYYSDFRYAMPAVICGLFCQLFASYYSFLRGDPYHTFQFAVYLIFWTTKTVSPLLQATNVVISTGNNDYQYFGSCGIVLVLLFLSMLSINQNLVLLVYNVVLLLTGVVSFESIPVTVSNYTFGVLAFVNACMVSYLSLASLLNSIAEKPIVYIGAELVSASKLRLLLSSKNSGSQPNESVCQNETVLPGYSSDILIVDGLFYTINAIAAMSLSPYDLTGVTIAMTSYLISCVFLHLFSARLAYASGSFARTYNSLAAATVWMSWCINGIGGIESSFKLASLGAMSFQVLSCIMSLACSKVWMAVSFLMLGNCIACVLTAFGVNATFSTLTTGILLGMTCLYGLLAFLIKIMTGCDILPTGTPLLQGKEPEEKPLPCDVFPSRKTSGLHECARLLDEGKVVGIPTDTVYALGASCKHPESVNAIYHIKGRPPEKPICLCISSLDQLKVANPDFSPLLWKFMDLCYPGGITCTVRKGEWLKRLGVGDSYDHIGKKDSVAIRVPDSAVLSYLTSVTGPLAITSANPSGEPDSLHHDMVLSGLGHKLAGVVCDDESRELKPSTVVNCLDIDKGVISYFRIGCVSQEKVDALFEQAKLEVIQA